MADGQPTIAFRMLARALGGGNTARHSFRVLAEVIREEQPDVLT